MHLDGKLPNLALMRLAALLAGRALMAVHAAEVARP